MDASKPPSGKRMKSRAPAPPPVPQPAPRRIFRGAESQDEASVRDMKENLLRESVELRLTLPTGFHTTVTEDGSKALMDVLVEVCSRYHLNPSLHTLELFTPEGHSLGFKPNALLGSLNVACALIKEKVLEERQVRRPAPKVPEKTVRLLVNYHGSQKAVVRVNPLLPLQDLIPVICDKCEFDPAHTVFLKDSISRQELPLNKSLSHMGIKELYAHDKSLVLQPKMASAPALNYSDSLHYSTNSLARAEKKGLLGMFQFTRRKSKTETTSLDMDTYNDPETNSDAMSSMLGASYVEERPHMSQSQSAVNISRTSPKAEAKKRRAPAPPRPTTHSTESINCDTPQMSLGTDTQQRKRKAPAPPPTPVSISSDSEDVSAAATPVIHVPIPITRTKVSASQTLTATTVIITDVTPVAPEPSAVDFTHQDHKSSTTSITTSESLVVQDSSSELSQSLEESDGASQCSTTTGSMVSGSAQAPSKTKSSVSETRKSERTTKLSTSDVTTASSSKSDTESTINLKIEETENNRHSGVAWLHSSSAFRGQYKEISPEETVSLGSNSSGISLPDQVYAASEGMVDGEDSGMVSSPSETHTTSPDGSLSLDGSNAGEKCTGTATDNLSDSDEPSWSSQHRRSDTQPRTDLLKHHDQSAQFHQTLVESCHAVPVSIVDHDVPVTTIDEVLPDEGFWAEPISANASNHSDELQNRNNNAHTATKSKTSYSTESKPAKRKEKKETNLKPKANETNKTDATIKNKSSSEGTSFGQDSNKITEATILNKTLSEATSSVQYSNKITKATVISKTLSEATFSGQDSNTSDSKPEEKKIYQATLTTSTQPSVAVHRVQQTVSTSKPLQSKITQNATSRFGTRTFTVIPPKPTVLPATGQPAFTSPGAIKIDEQGNMVKVSHQRSPVVSDYNNHDSPLHGKAKAFWTSSEKQEIDVGPNKSMTDTSRQNLDKSWTRTSETAQMSTEAEIVKTNQGTLNKPTVPTEPKETVEEEDTAKQMKDIDLKQNNNTGYKILPTINSSQRPLQPPFITDVRRDLTFLKPSRRTSSQYVASAITKYTPSTVVKPTYNAVTQELPIKTQNTTYVKSGRSIQINPQTSLYSKNMNKPPGPKRSISTPEHMSDMQDSSDERHEGNAAEKNFESDKGSFRIQATQRSANNQPETFKPIQHRSPSFSTSCAQNSSEKSLPELKSGHQEQNVPVTTRTSNLQTPNLLKTNDTPSVTVTDPPEPAAATVFGPVKKFRPVICKSVEKETCLHSSLMEAIQNGGGKERLKKISRSGSNLKKSSYIEEENERSALMAAIRDQGNSGRLKKTKSEAAEELEHLRETVHDVRGSVQVSSMPLSPSSVPSAPIHTIAPPPPPPPVLLAPKPFKPSDPSMNPALAREAMLEAIRSGSAAEKLKKVVVPAKTVQVNGKLGTIKATSSTVS